jgi:hypothetical protein
MDGTEEHRLTHIRSDFPNRKLDGPDDRNRSNGSEGLSVAPTRQLLRASATDTTRCRQDIGLWNVRHFDDPPTQPFSDVVAVCVNGMQLV